MDKSVREANSPTKKVSKKVSGHSRSRTWAAANVGRNGKSGVKREQEGTRASECPRMTRGDTRVRARARVVHTFAERNYQLSDRLPGYANSNVLRDATTLGNANARLRWRERTLFPPPPPFLFTGYSHTTWINRRIEIVARVSVADASSILEPVHRKREHR